MVFHGAGAGQHAHLHSNVAKKVLDNHADTRQRFESTVPVCAAKQQTFHTRHALRAQATIKLEGVQ